jgi:hypothetical protein
MKRPLLTIGILIAGIDFLSQCRLLIPEPQLAIKSRPNIRSTFRRSGC